MSAAERHNRISAEMVQTLGRETQSGAELMVLVESFITGAMLLNYKLYGMKPSIASEMVEHALDQAMQRFTQAIKDGA